MVRNVLLSVTLTATDVTRIVGSRELNYQTISSPLATQLPHAVGAAYAQKMAATGALSVVFFGDGAASEGDFHAALNFAATTKTPSTRGRYCHYASSRSVCFIRLHPMDCIQWQSSMTIPPLRSGLLLPQQWICHLDPN